MVEVKVKIKIKDADDTPTLRDGHVSNQLELRKIFLCGDLRARSTCVLLAHIGLRIETLGNYEGTDGLRNRDLPEMKVEKDEVVFEKVPTMVVVRRELSKRQLISLGKNFIRMLPRRCLKLILLIR